MKRIILILSVVCNFNLVNVFAQFEFEDDFDTYITGI